MSEPLSPELEDVAREIEDAVFDAGCSIKGSELRDLLKTFADEAQTQQKYEQWRPGIETRFNQTK